MQQHDGRCVRRSGLSVEDLEAVDLFRPVEGARSFGGPLGGLRYFRSRPRRHDATDHSGSGCRRYALTLGAIAVHRGDRRVGCEYGVCHHPEVDHRCRVAIQIGDLGGRGGIFDDRYLEPALEEVSHVRLDAQIGRHAGQNHRPMPLFRSCRARSLFCGNWHGSDRESS